LYHWTGEVGGALLADYRHLEVVYRNAVDNALQAHVERLSGWTAGVGWFDESSWARHHWFDRHAERELRTAKRRARRGSQPANRGAVVAELPFGFWRYIASARYEQTFWVPVLDDVFDGIAGARPGDRRVVLENHLIPLNMLVEVLRWIDADLADWIESTSPVKTLLQAQP